jgi:hypothetical protein
LDDRGVRGGRRTRAKRPWWLIRAS